MKTEITSWLYCIFDPCSRYKKLIASACCEELSEDESHEIEEHINKCSKCKQLYYDLVTFTKQLNRVLNIIDTEDEEEKINLLPQVMDEISNKNHSPSPLFRPQLIMAYGFTIVFIVFIFGISSIFILKGKYENNNRTLAVSTGTNNANSFYEGPLEKQKEKLKEIIKTNTGKSIAGQALLMLADLEYTSSERYEEAYQLYSQLRENYPQIFSSSQEAVYRYNLLEETKNEKFKPLYALNSALTNSNNPIQQLEKIVANYPGTMVANLAVSSMVDCLSDYGSQTPEKRIKTLENLKGYLTEPTAVAQVNYILGDLYWNQMKDIDKAKTFFQSVAHSESKQLHPLANEALTRLVSSPE
ncbi:MAG TPA: tetratricopeptide repeat protein [Candidatus Hydrogenedens sp.]|nr:tetratricopeptide repeat protein [Candidatus Hydrogenedens sp.]